MKKRAAYIAAVRYVLLAILTAFSGWLQQLGKTGWETLSTFDIIYIITVLGISGLSALGAVMNSRWAEAREEDQNGQK